MNVIDDNKNLLELDSSEENLVEITCTVGSTYYIDGIQVVCIKEGNALSMGGLYLFDGSHEGNIPIFVDKNHDLSYYLEGDDFSENSLDYSSGLGSNNPKYGYEWGGYGSATGVQNKTVGSGLSNTNTLIGKNLKSNTSGWPVLWNKVLNFRNCYDHNWFVPSIEEAALIIEYKDLLVNLPTQAFRLSSSTENENDPNNLFWCISQSGVEGSGYKNQHHYRTRLCRQIGN